MGMVWLISCAVDSSPGSGLLIYVIVHRAGGEAVKCQTKDGLTIFQVLQQSPNVTVFTSLIQQAKMIPTFNNKATQLTIFVPLDYAFGNLLPLGKGFYDIFPGVDIPRVLVNYHLAIPAIPPKKLKEDLDLTAGLKDAKVGVRFTVYAEIIWCESEYVVSLKLA